MPLINFGSILNFAEQIETQDQEFYTGLAENKACADYKTMFQQFALDGKKNQKTVQRIRRENVTEMILEGISNFTKDPYLEKQTDPKTLNAGDALTCARRLEERADRYYMDAAEKIKALSEVSRALKLIAKTRKAHLKKIDQI